MRKIFSHLSRSYFYEFLLDLKIFFYFLVRLVHLGARDFWVYQSSMGFSGFSRKSGTFIVEGRTSRGGRINNRRIQVKTKWMPPVKFRETSMMRISNILQALLQIGENQCFDGIQILCISDYIHTDLAGIQDFGQLGIL